MHSFAATLMLACCMGPIAIQAVAQTGNPNNTVPYGSQTPSAQTPPTHATPADTPAPATYTGCVQQLPTDKTTLVLSTESICAKLTGTFSATQLDGHQVDLKGVLTPRTSTLPASLRVDSVVTVGKVCSDVCSLRPPKSRGLGKGGEIPGRQGGTPGEAPTQPPPSP
jgi:hypothetical protein